MKWKGWCQVAQRWKLRACCCPGRAVSLCRRLYRQPDPLTPKQASPMVTQHLILELPVDEADAAGCLLHSAGSESGD